MGILYKDKYFLILKSATKLIGNAANNLHNKNESERRYQHEHHGKYFGNSHPIINKAS
jgi:hypothetical protein